MLHRAVLALAAGLSACASAPPAPAPPPSSVAAAASALPDPGVTIDAVYAAASAAGGRVYALDPTTSTVRIYAFRAGRAARLGHNHVLAAPRFMGYVQTGDADAAARFDIVFRLDALAVDRAADRALLGPAFASVLTAEAIAATREHMLGNAGLQADRFPYVHIHALQLRGEAPRLAAEVQIELHGRTHDVWVPLVIEQQPTGLTVDGSFVLRQTDFGVQPYTVAGGLLGVQDELVIEFKLIGGQSPLTSPQ